MAETTTQRLGRFLESCGEHLVGVEPLEVTGRLTRVAGLVMGHGRTCRWRTCA